VILVVYLYAIGFFTPFLHDEGVKLVSAFEKFSKKRRCLGVASVTLVVCLRAIGIFTPFLHDEGVKLVSAFECLEKF
jgi:tryptophan synthase beta subunit